jgi:hypothetical protein
VQVAYNQGSNDPAVPPKTFGTPTLRLAKSPLDDLCIEARAPPLAHLPFMDICEPVNVAWGYQHSETMCEMCCRRARRDAEPRRCAGVTPSMRASAVR